MSTFNYNEKQRFIVPTSDWGFKRLFGTEMNKDLLIGLLNRLLPEENILDVTYLNTELIIPVGDSDEAKKIIEARKGVVDVYCKCQDDRRIIVEMQNWAKPAFVDRAVVYAAASILENYTLSKSRGYDVRKTYFIAITGTSVFPDLGHAPVRMGLCDLDASEVVPLSKKVLLMFIELPKFAKSVGQLCEDSSFLDQFSVTMRTMSEVDEKPERMRDELIEKMFRAADIRHYTKTDTDQYNLSMQRNSIEYWATLEDYFNDGMDKGRAEGQMIGMEKGMEKGRKEGREEGISTMTEAMRLQGFSQQQIDSLLSAVQKS